MKNKAQLGFTLTEVLIVMAIIAIIAMIAFPSYQDSVRKSRRTDGKSAVLETVAMEEKHYFQFSKYTTDLELLEGCGNPSCAPSTEGYYSVSISQPCGSTACFTVTAVPVGAQVDDDKCASLSVSHTGLKSAKDINNNDSTDICW